MSVICNRIARAGIAATACALFAFTAHAGVGLTVLPATATDGPVTMFYPSGSAARTVQRGEFNLDVAEGGMPERGNGRLIVISHGSGASPWPSSDLARYLVAAGFIVALPEHAGDNWHDMSKIGPESWKLRPVEVSHAIDAVGRDARFAPLVDLGRVGVWGMSAGGHTALTLAGGRWSPARLKEHCEAHIAEDFAACTGAAAVLTGGALDGIKKGVALLIIRWRLSDAQSQGHTDPRIKAIVAGVPFAADYDMATLVTPRVPLGLIQAEQDVWLVPKFHSGPVIRACTTCVTLASLPKGGHGALLAPLPHNLPARLERLLADPSGFDRAAELPGVYQRTTSFFQKHLLP